MFGTVENFLGAISGGEKIWISGDTCCIFAPTYRSRLNFSDEDLIWRFISSKFNLHFLSGRFLTFHQSCSSLHSFFKAQKRLKN